jgi:hypothetical protein
VSGKQTPEEQVVDLMHETQWTIAGWCMHLSLRRRDAWHLVCISGASSVRST